MKINKIILKKFKRFDDLTIDLTSNSPKIIALIGPNGCGKSSIFDAFELVQKNHRSSSDEPDEFYSKAHFYAEETTRATTFNRNESVVVDTVPSAIKTNSFYIRTAYRFTSKLNVSTLEALPDIITHGHPGSSISLDNRMSLNYSRLLGLAYEQFDKVGTKTGNEVKKELIGEINKALENVLDIKISSLGSITDRKGTLQFEKGNVKNFPYANLSAGEKEVVDLLADLLLKKKDFDNTIFCIDEPELHINTSVQRKLLIEIEKLIPENCQLWVATHSVGFIRALQEELKSKSVVLDFSEKDYFTGTHVIAPMLSSRKNWQRIFTTALDDLTHLLAPKKIVYCEGLDVPTADIEDQGLDAEVYNRVFHDEFSETLFISAGGGQLVRNASVALAVLNKAFKHVELRNLKDRDGKTSAERKAFLETNDRNRMLKRRELENYLFDKEVLKAFCENNGKTFNENRYDQAITNLEEQDLKPQHQQIKQAVSFDGSIAELKRELAAHILPGTSCYDEMKQCIFP